MNELNIQLQLLKMQLLRYPQAQAQDLFKLLYQQEFGCGHLLTDPDAALIRLQEEALGAPSVPHPMEPIGNGLCRLHLSLVRRGKLRGETLTQMFALSAQQTRGTTERFLHRVSQLEELCQGGALPLSPLDVRALTDQWIQDGMPIPRHSDSFRTAYQPAYRVVEERFVPFLPLFEQLDHLLQSRGRVLLAIDGNCAAGKSTLAAMLRQVYRGTVIPMDHFFLRPEQRTPQRLAAPGGNVDYERFAREVLSPLKEGRPFSYRPYDCGVQQLGSPVLVEPHPLTVVEGSYSLHPTLAAAYDCSVFLRVAPAEQLQRILLRNGPEMAKRFQSQWIPMEERYFEAFSIPLQCDLVFDTGTALQIR